MAESCQDLIRTCLKYCIKLNKFAELRKERLFLKNEDCEWREKQKPTWVSAEQRGMEDNEGKTPMEGSGLRSQGTARESQGPPLC